VHVLDGFRHDFGFDDASTYACADSCAEAGSS
jgi:hypothetical protein